MQAPFCVHPKTGKVCVPVRPEEAYEFDPDTVCTVGGLLNQLNSSGSAAAQVWPAAAPLLRRACSAGCRALDACRCLLL